MSPVSHSKSESSHQEADSAAPIAPAQTKRAFKVIWQSVALIALVAAGYGIWLQWPTILLTSLQWQKQLVNQMSELLYLTHQNRESMWQLAQISFLYGMFHSLGPGHGKVVVSTYLATHNTKIKIGLYITVISALVQAVTAIVLVTGVLLVLEASMRHLNSVVNQFFHASYAGVFLLGGYIVWQGIKQWRRGRASDHTHNHNHNHNHNHDHHHDHHSHDHQHSADCGCGHKHLASADELNQATTLKEYAAMVISIGLRPCTGAILVLFFANLADVYWLGVVSSFLMAIGTAITTSSIALMTVSGRKFVRLYLKDSSVTRINLWPWLRMAAGLLLMLVAVILFNQGGFGMSPMFN